ncbi:MAG: radical SAM protein [Gemmatimonadetes bacterium]|nr:radical SAM protein [Gemmatimonadota bacterium]MYH18948.1 radical SAM protein [Gemmatimonadota bacterium]MYK99176.1 radical SAM protein [Gemmatimonadota bacterium]
MFGQSLAETLARERGTIYKNPGGKAVRIALVYPNTYYLGMSNLGFQTMYRHLNERDDVVCERAFLPEPSGLEALSRTRKPLVTLESGLPLGSCDIVAFSVSFENDYPNLVRILELARVPVLAEDRTRFDPIVLIGGAITYINPEPLADFADVMVIGDGEEAAYAYIDRYLADQGLDREQHLAGTMSLAGMYVPSLQTASPGDREGTPAVGAVTDAGMASNADVGCDPADTGCDAPDTGSDAPAAEAESAPVGRIAKQQVRDFEDYPAHSAVLTPDTEFGDMLLIEISRGCPRRCRFCAVSYVYPKFRALKPDTILEVIRSKNASLARDGKEGLKAVGLVSSAMCDYPHLDELCAGLEETGLRVGVSSVRVDLVPDSLLRLMLKTGLRTMTIAPEAGSERLRKAINKPISSEEILTGARRILEKGIKHLKVYYMVGLPTETDADIEELIEMTRRLARLQRECGEPGGRLRLSINPFVPKALTPFQWSPMASPKEVRRKLHRIQKALRGTAGVDVKHESLKSAYFEAILSRGGRELSGFLMETARREGDWKRAAAELGMDTSRYLGDMADLQSLPWDFISTEKENHRLQWEYRKSHRLPYRKRQPVPSAGRPDAGHTAV